ncbi:hypothetical protein Y1Q_0022948 [Alligator mississippiensis]|uniref:Uncharacterized protein n=1 Tax=Alligator mississippiensis TaxID=8496 RepID=A0A151P723_ALLMI|nr:hypothetical protein Y1Q_0022948 [Alligator mississippiensis]
MIYSLEEESQQESLKIQTAAAPPILNLRDDAEKRLLADQREKRGLTHSLLFSLLSGRRRKGKNGDDSYYRTTEQAGGDHGSRENGDEG